MVPEHTVVVAGVIVLITATGLTVKVTTSEVTVPQYPLVKITLYLFPVNKVADFLIFKLAVL